MTTPAPSADAQIARLRREWSQQTANVRNEVAALVRRAGMHTLGPYRTDAFELGGYSLDDAAQEWTTEFLERTSPAQVADLLARATSPRGLLVLLEQRAKWWATDRFKRTFSGNLLRRIRNLPAAVPERFAWVVRLRWLGLCGGPQLLREDEGELLAARVHRAPAIDDLRREMLRREWIGKHGLRPACAVIIEAHAAAARPELVLDVVLVLVGRGDGRPRVLRLRDAVQAGEQLDLLADQAEAVHDALCTGASWQRGGGLRARYRASIDGRDDPQLRAALRAALQDHVPDRQDRAAVLRLLDELIEGEDMQRRCSS